DRGGVAVVPGPVPCPAREMNGVPGPPVDALPVDLGPAAAGLDELDRVPRVAVHRRHRVRRTLMNGRVEILRGPVRIPTGVYAAADAAARHVVHHDVLPLEDCLVVALPLVEQRLAALLLDLVVRGLRRGGRLHRELAPARAPLTCGNTSRASV